MNSGAAPANAYRTAGGAGDTEGVDVSGVTVFRGTPMLISRLANCSYQFLWTGTPTGTFTIQVSNKPNPDLATDTDWTTLTLATAITQPAGSASNDFVDLSGLPALWVRPRYVNAASTGKIFAFSAGKP